MHDSSPSRSPIAAPPAACTGRCERAPGLAHASARQTERCRRESEAGADDASSATDSRWSRLTRLQSRYHPHCLVCAPENPAGFSLNFRVLDSHAVAASFTCDERFRGYQNWLHGGAIATILDAAMTNCLFASGLVAVTAELRVRFRQPLPTGSEATVRAWVTHSIGPLHTLAAEIVHAGRIAASASGKFVEHVPPRLGPPASERGRQDLASKADDGGLTP